MDHEVLGMVLEKTWLALAVVAGAMTGTLMQKGLNLPGKLTAFFIGLTASLFCSEYVLAWLNMPVDSKASAIMYLIAVCANNVLPSIIKRVSDRFNDPLSLTKKDAAS